ncbi:MAG TPA: tyrosine-type recombinase/integrase [Nitrososphaeraceae archaeon]
MDFYDKFMYLYPAAASKDTAKRRLRMFLEFARIPGSESRERCNNFAQRAKSDVSWCEAIVYSYLSHLKDQYENEKKISAGTIKNRKIVVKNLFEILKIPFDWKLVTRGLPKPERYSNDRAPTIEEIRKICEYNDRRIKPIVYTMCSSGIRLGAWEYLKWKHITPIKRDGKVIAALIEVYADTDSQYPTLITEESYNSLGAWMDFRKDSGEEITGDSWVMRHYWDTKEGFTHGKIGKPTKLSKDGIKGLIDSALRRQGLRKNLMNGKKRHDFKLNHSFRKWRETQLILAGLKQQDINILMGHENSGMVDHYYRPWANGEQKIDNYLINEFLKASDYLSIQREYRLQSKVESLEERQNEIALMKTEHEREMQQMDKKLDNIMAIIRQNPKLAGVKPESLKKKLK